LLCPSCDPCHLDRHQVSKDPQTLHCESQVPQLPRAISGPRLAVPPAFQRFQFSVIYTELGATQGTLMDQQQQMLRAILRQFTRDLTKGCVVICVVEESSGRNAEHVCRLDSGLTKLSLRPVTARSAKVEASSGRTTLLGGGQNKFSGGWQAEDQGAKRELVFREIERVCSPQEVRNLSFPGILHLDECCTTVVLSGKQLLTFRLESVLAREYFMLCLQVLRMSQDQGAKMWYS